MRRHARSFVRTIRGDRGTSLVEYALIIGVLLVGLTISLDSMDRRMETHYSETARDIGHPELSDFEPPPPTTAPPPTTTVDDDDD